MNELLKIAERAAIEAGSVIKAIRESGALNLSYKGERDLLTSADLAAESVICKLIRDNFPDHVILAEESSPNLQTPGDYLKPLWVIDPVDGTTNFVQGHYQVGVSIAFADQGKTQAAVVHAPFLNETYAAIRGQGASLNDAPIRVSVQQDLRRALIGTGVPYDRRDVAKIIRRIESVLNSCRDIRRLGAASLDLCYVACGRLEGFYETLAPWDIAAGAFIAAEAGAKRTRLSVADPDIVPDELSGEDLVVACPGIFEQLCAIL